MRLICALFAALTLSSPGFAQEFSGSVEILYGDVLLPQATGERFVLQPGEVRLAVETPWFFQVGKRWRGEKTLLISQGDREYRAGFLSDEAIRFATMNLELGEYRLVGSTEIRDSVVREEDGSEFCTYSGYCLACSPGLGFDGQMKMDCSFKFNMVCTGSQSARYQVVRDLVETGIDIHHAGSVVARMRAQPEWVQRSRKLLRVTGSCL